VGLALSLVDKLRTFTLTSLVAIKSEKYESDIASVDSVNRYNVLSIRQ